MLQNATRDQGEGWTVHNIGMTLDNTKQYVVHSTVSGKDVAIYTTESKANEVANSMVVRAREASVNSML